MFTSTLNSDLHFRQTVHPFFMKFRHLQRGINQESIQPQRNLKKSQTSSPLCKQKWPSTFRFPQTHSKLVRQSNLQKAKPNVMQITSSCCFNRKWEQVMKSIIDDIRSQWAYSQQEKYIFSQRPCLYGKRLEGTTRGCQYMNTRPCVKGGGGVIYRLNGCVTFKLTPPPSPFLWRPLVAANDSHFLLWQENVNDTYGPIR